MQKWGIWEANWKEKTEMQRNIKKYRRQIARGK